jgi:proteic killer suppression protein
VIVSFRCPETEKIFREQKSRKFGNIPRAAFRKLVMLHAAEKLADLAGAGASLEALRGGREGQYAIRVNDQFRICVVWNAGEARSVEIIDYHYNLSIKILTFSGRKTKLLSEPEG